MLLVASYPAQTDNYVLECKTSIRQVQDKCPNFTFGPIKFQLPEPYWRTFSVEESRN